MIPLSKTNRYQTAAVIGCGPSGLQAAGELLKQNFKVTIFERHSQLGGTWCYDRNNELAELSTIKGVKPFLHEKVSAVYDELRTNVPFQCMAIGDFPIPQPEDIRYGHRSEVLAHLQAYADHLNQMFPTMLSYRFNTTIQSVFNDSGWVVVSETSGKTAEEEFDVVVVATGPFHKPAVTNLHHPEFAGTSFHSMYYDDPSVLNDRTVLIIGGKNSARDIFWDAMERAKHVVIASPTEQDRNNLVLPEGRFTNINERFTSIGRVLHIDKDGSVLHSNWDGHEERFTEQKVDLVIYCTGYKREFSFLSEANQPFYVSPNGTEISNCYLYSAHQSHPDSLFFFHPIKGRTPFNTMARDTHAQARLIAMLAAEKPFSVRQLDNLDQTLQEWLTMLFDEWAKETLNSCPCAAQNPFLMNFFNAVADYDDHGWFVEDPSADILAAVRHRMQELDFRRINTIWHAGMNLRVRPDGVNWNRFRFLRGRLTSGPNIDDCELYEVTWFTEDGRYHSSYREDEIKYESLILNDLEHAHPPLEYAY